MTRKSTRNCRKRRGNSRYIMCFAFITLLLIFCSWGIVHLLKQLDWFNVTKIIVTGNINLEEDLLQEIAAEYIGQNLYSIPLRSITYKYDNFVRIEKLRIRRVFPNRLKLLVQERVGFMYIRTSEGTLVPIDRERVILDRRGSYLNEDIPLLHTKLKRADLTAGEIIKNDLLERVYNVHQQIINNNIDERLISDYFVIDDNLFFTETKSGGQICLGIDNYENKIEKFAFILDNFGIDGSSVIDLRFEDQVVMRSGGI